MNETLKWSAHGKWILAGEHAVIRGFPALVFPLYQLKLQCHYIQSGDPLTVEFGGAEGEPLKLLFWGVVENALEKCGHHRSDLTGRLWIDTDLPLGTGLGASAALCVAVGLWWKNLGWIADDEVYEFSRRLEDMFHGESSGVDIAASMADGGIYFRRGGERRPITAGWTPHWYLSYSGHRGVTSECVKKVKDLALTEPEKFRRLDEQMAAAVADCERALVGDRDLSRLAAAIGSACDCFYEWGLIDPEMEKHLRGLKARGALAVKPTGSGGGGYVLSLWAEPPAKDLRLIPLHETSAHK